MRYPKRQVATRKNGEAPVRFEFAMREPPLQFAIPFPHRVKGGATGRTSMQANPDYTIRIVPHPARLRVLWNGNVIADTTDALMLHEASYPAVPYVPRADVDMTLLTKSPRKTHCPYKGEASYFSLQSGGVTANDAVWSYETPFPAVKSIAGYLAFDPKEAEFVENNAT
jgi:uncharacterized protein (DUF427 family)